MIGILKKGLVKIKNFKVPPKKVKDQCLSNCFACPKYLSTQVLIVNEYVATWKPCVGIGSAIALPFGLKLQEKGDAMPT